MGAFFFLEVNLNMSLLMAAPETLAQQFAIARRFKEMAVSNFSMGVLSSIIEVSVVYHWVTSDDGMVHFDECRFALFSCHAYDIIRNLAVSGKRFLLLISNFIARLK